MAASKSTSPSLTSLGALPVLGTSEEDSARLSDMKPRRRWPVFLFGVAWLTAVINLFVALGQNLAAHGAPGDFWVLVRNPGYTPIYFCFFFAAAVVLSQFAHWILAFVSGARVCFYTQS